MALAKVYAILAARLQEADTLELSNEDLRSALQDCLNDYYPGQYCSICNVFGDGESGDVVYYCEGQYQRVAYSVGMANGKRTHSIDTDEAENVLPRVVYDLEADEDDVDADYAGMTEAQRQEKLVEGFPGSAGWKRPFSERFISKTERDSMDDSDFAGNYDGSPNKRSFPIKKAADVMAAVRSIGRGVSGGHSSAKLKGRIKSIAKKKGFALPKAWQADSSEAGV